MDVLRGLFKTTRSRNIKFLKEPQLKISEKAEI